MTLPRTGDASAFGGVFAASGSAIVVGAYRSNDAGKTWIDSGLPSNSPLSTKLDAFVAGGHMVGYRSIDTASVRSFYATDYDLAAGVFTQSASSLPARPTTMSATWMLHRTSELVWMAYDYVNGTPEAPLQVPAGAQVGTSSATVTATNGILWTATDRDGKSVVAYAPSPTDAPSAWAPLTAGGSTGVYSVADADPTTLRYVAKMTDGLFFCKLPLADLTLSAQCIAADPANESNASVLSRTYGSWSLIATGSADGVSAKAFVWSGDTVTRISLPGNAPVAYASVGDTPYVVLAGPSNTLNRLAPDGTLASPSTWPTMRVTVGALALGPDRVLATVSNSGTGPNVWWAPVSGSGFGSATALSRTASLVAATAGRAVAVGPDGTTAYDRNQISATVTSSTGPLAASGPYIATGWLPNLWLANGAQAATTQYYDNALFGSLAFAGWPDRFAAGPSFHVTIDDLTGSTPSRSVDLSGPDQCGQNFLVWGDLVAPSCQDYALRVFSLKTGTLVASVGTPGVDTLSPVGIGDGYLIVFDYKTQVYEVWRLSDNTLIPLPECLNGVVPATDGVGHVVCASSTELIWRDFSSLSTSAPRLLGVLAESSVDFGFSSWTPEIDTTKPLRAGSLVITSSDGSVVKTLATPGSPDGSLRGLSWDGRDESGKPVGVGTYTYTLKADAQDGTGTVVSIDGTGTGSGKLTVTSYGHFIKASYQDFLGRAPSDAEFTSQNIALSTGKATKVGYLTSLANSDEWLSTIVTKMYADTLGRNPDPEGLAFWINLLRTKTFTVAEVAARFYSSDEYYTLHAGANTTSWVTNLYAKLLNRTPDPGGLQFWINHTSDPSWGRDKVAYNFYQSEESRRDRVQAMYEVLLNRGPDSVGWPFWTQRVLTTGDIALAYDIANSQEYWDKAATRF